VIASARLDSRGDTVVTAGSDGRALVISARNGATVATLTGSERALLTATFTPDGRHVMTGAEDGLIRKFDLAAPERAMATITLGKRLWSVTLSADGRSALALGDDRGYVVRLDGTMEHLELPGHGGPTLIAGAMSPDGARAVTVATEGAPRLWRIGWTTMLASIAGSTSACLTPEQRIRYFEARADAEQRYRSCEKRQGRQP
jgi:WD40 repeat protein